MVGELPISASDSYNVDIGCVPYCYVMSMCKESTQPALWPELHV